MININKSLKIIRCNKYQYLIKKGSMSNYSFDILDEDKNGILDLLFEKIIYPINKIGLEKKILNECKEITKEKADEFIKKLEDIEVLVNINKNNQPVNITIITDSNSMRIIKEKFKNLNYNIKNLILDNTKLELTENTKFIEAFKKANYVLIFSNYFSPNLFYKINYYAINFNKKIIISYLDGDEGIIVPITNPNKSGCYNDFEMLREASFHNLVDYQIMKEYNLTKENKCDINRFYYNMLIDQTILLLNKLTSYTNINSYAYSFDYERMINSKIRLLKFPKCPSCQGDFNLTHPFI